MVSLGAILFILLAGLDLWILLSISNNLTMVIVSSMQFITGLAGYLVLRKRDFRLLFFIETEFRKGETIILEIWEDGLEIVACLLLCLPGVLSDLAGFVLIFPQVRHKIVIGFQNIRKKSS